MHRLGLGNHSSLPFKTCIPNHAFNTIMQSLYVLLNKSPEMKCMKPDIKWFCELAENLIKSLFQY